MGCDQSGFVADESLSADRLELEELSLPLKRGEGFPGPQYDIVGIISYFHFSWDLAGSRLASNSKLDARSVQVESRLSAGEMMLGSKLQMMDTSLLFSVLHCPNERLRLILAFCVFQKRTWGFDLIWVDMGFINPPLIWSIPVRTFLLVCSALHTSFTAKIWASLDWILSRHFFCHKDTYLSKS